MAMHTTVPELEVYEVPYSQKTMGLNDYYVELAKFSSKKFQKLAGPDTETTEELKLSLKTLEWDLKPYQVINLSRFALILSAILLAVVNIVAFILTGTVSPIVIAFCAVAPVVLAYFVTEHPKNEAHLARVEALSNAPSILTQLVIYLKQNPNLERAIEFVSKYSEGKIVDDLKNALWRSFTGHKINIKTELGEIAQKWGKELVELKRSIYLIKSAVSEKNEIKRNQTFDRAINIALEGITNKIQDYTNKLYLPTMFLFSFGTVLPLVIISLLPIFSFIGKEVSSPMQMFLLLILSLIGIYIYSNRIIAQRPPAFSTIKLPEFMEGFPKPSNLKFRIGKTNFEFNALYYTIVVFLVIAFPGIIFMLSQIPGIQFADNPFSQMLKGFNTLTVVWAVGAAIALYCYGSSWFKRDARQKIENLEKEMIDGTYQLASRISEGRSPENTIKYISESTPGTLFGTLMTDTYDVIKSRHVTLEEALFNHEYGSLKNIYSKNLLLIMHLFVNSLKHGIYQCSQMLFTISNHFDQLKKTEEKLKDTLKNSLSMMRITASVFAPMITGLVITLQQLIQNGMAAAREKLGGLGYEYFNLSFLNPPALNVEMLQLIAGVYMLILAVLLIRYVCLLEYGKDMVILRYELAKNLPIALFIFTFTLILSRIMLS
jgi:hypothetical protein